MVSLSKLSLATFDRFISSALSKGQDRPTPFGIVFEKCGHWTPANESLVWHTLCSPIENTIDAMTDRYPTVSSDTSNAVTEVLLE